MVHILLLILKIIGIVLLVLLFLLLLILCSLLFVPVRYYGEIHKQEDGLENWRSAGKFPGCSGCLYWRASIGTDRRKALSECWEFLCTGSAEETGQGKKSRKAKERPQRQKRERT